jgi:hypothetical protein
VVDGKGGQRWVTVGRGGGGCRQSYYFRVSWVRVGREVPWKQDLEGWLAAAAVGPTVVVGCGQGGQVVMTSTAGWWWTTSGWGWWWGQATVVVKKGRVEGEGWLVGGEVASGRGAVVVAGGGGV